jgi:hypothetical protein
LRLGRWNPAMLGICKFINGHHSPDQVNNIPKKYAQRRTWRKWP